MLRIEKNPIEIPFDEIVVFTAVMMLYHLLIFLYYNTPDKPMPVYRYLNIDASLTATPTPTSIPTSSPSPTPEVEYMSEFAEEIGEEFNCLMYATEPIGRYYITAYNHLETGSKATASGATCHEGNITTCAADPRYHKFGEYLEVDGRIYRVEDTGSAVKKRHIDIYFASYKQMARYGSNYQTIYRVSFPFGKPKN